MMISDWRKRLALIAALLICQVTSAQDAGWEVVTHNRRAYLPLENIRASYGFDAVEIEDDAFEFQSPSASIIGLVGADQILVNGMRYQLHFVPIKKNGKVLLSAYDLTNLVDLLLRPSAHLTARPLKTVYLQGVVDEFATSPAPRELTFILQDAFSSMGLNVRFLSQETTGIVGDTMEVDEEGAAIWFRLQGNGKLSHRHVRVSTLAPPGAPSRRQADGSVSPELNSVYFGNIYDSESIALATLLQSGMVFGPGASDGRCLDGGIRQTSVPAFRNASSAAVHVEWGEEVEVDHLIKSIMAGVVRYAAYLEAEVERQQRVRAQRAQTVRLGPITSRLDEENGNLYFRVQLHRADGIPDIDPEKVEVQSFLFTREGAAAINLAETPPPRVRWVSILPEWTSDSPQELELMYPIGHDEVGRLRRTSFGHVVRLIYDGRFQELESHPQGLQNQLWRFSPIFPRR